MMDFYKLFNDKFEKIKGLKGLNERNVGRSKHLGSLYKASKYKYIVIIEYGSKQKLIRFDKKRKAKSCFKKLVALNVGTVTFMAIKKDCMDMRISPMPAVEKISVGTLYIDGLAMQATSWKI